MTSQSKPRYTPEEYLAIERDAEGRREYCDGEIFAMSGAIDHYVRQPDNRWLLSEASNLDDTVKLASINCALALSEIYDKVEIGI